MKNTLKQKNNFLKNSHIIKILSVLLFLSFIFVFVYNQGKGVLEAEEIEEAEERGRLFCGKEIPVGEAMEKTGELLKEIIREMEEIKKNSLNLITYQNDMKTLAKKCNLDNCRPSCKRELIEPIIYDASGNPLDRCVAQDCEGDPCPKEGSEEGKEKIGRLFNEITNLNKKIQASKDKIYKLIYEKVEPPCIKTNEDIRTLEEKALCTLSPLCWEVTRETFLAPAEELLGDVGLCPRITVQEAIKRKLNLSRGEFDKCYVPPADWEKVFRGEEEGKILFNCEIVMSQNLPRETKTIEEGEVPICTSLHNWFCCY